MPPHKYQTYYVDVRNHYGMFYVFSWLILSIRIMLLNDTTLNDIVYNA